MVRYNHLLRPLAAITFLTVIPGCHVTRRSHTEQGKIDLMIAPVNGKFGFIDGKGTLVIPARFDVAGRFSEGLASVSVGGKFGFIDGEGRTAIPLTFNGAGDFSDGLAKVQRGGLWGYVNHRGELAVPVQFKEADDFSEGLAPVSVYQQHDYDPLGLSRSFTLYIDKTGKMVIPPRFKLGSKFSEGRAAAEEVPDYSKPVGSASRGFIDRSGAWEIPPRFEDATDFSEGLAAAKQDGKWGFINNAGSWAIQPRFDAAESFSEGLAPVAVGGLWGFVRRDGTVIQPKYLSVDGFAFGIAPVWENKTVCRYIDKSGNTALVPKVPGRCAQFTGSGLAPVITNIDVGFQPQPGLDSRLLYISRSGDVVWPTGTSISSQIPQVIQQHDQERSPTGQSSPPDSQAINPNQTDEGSLTEAGAVVTFTPISTNEPCPYVVLDDGFTGASRPKQTSCDFIYEFSRVVGQKLLFLYRGTYPPVTMREWCQIRYNGKLYQISDSYTDKELVAIASRLPRLLNVEHVSTEAYKTLFESFPVNERGFNGALSQLRLYVYNSHRVWR